MKESLEKKKIRANQIYKVFEQVYKGADCTLDYENALQLLIATQLAAQCTDARVNMVTPALFKKYPDVYAFANADELELREDIRSTGFFRNKAKNIIGCCKMLIEEFDGEVPKTMEELLKLPGVGRKTANLIVGDVYKKPAVVADTHVIRITNLLGLVNSKDPKVVEMELKKILPPDESNDFCHRIVLHGRKICIARRPKCDECILSNICKYKKDKK